MSTGISVKFKHAEIYNPQNFSRISALSAANTALSVQPTQTLFRRCHRVNKQAQIVRGRHRVCKTTAYRLVKVYTR